MSFYDTNPVFGLKFTQHDGRQMRHILRHYDRLPENGGDRVALFVHMVTLQHDLGEEEVERVSAWIKDGGDLPARPVVQRPRVRGSVHRSRILDVAPRDAEEADDEDEDEEEASDEDDSDSAEEEDDEEEEDNRVMASGEDNDLEESNVESDDDERLDLTDTISEMSEVEEDEATTDSDSGFENEMVKGDKPNREGTKYECCICAEVFPKFDIVWRVTSLCTHRNDICLTCLDTHVSTTIELGRLDCIQCPSCPSVLKYNDLRHHLIHETWERYQYLRDVKSRPENFFMCLAPTCGAGQVHVGAEPLMTCDHCGFETCVRHSLPWHKGFTCEEFDVQDEQIERLEQAEATAKLLSENSAICPKCKQCVVREFGCDHMSCHCGNGWCYHCMVDWENILRIGNTAHARSCRNHPEYSRATRNQLDARRNHLTELALGGQVNEVLNNARDKKNEARRQEMRPLVAEAAEKRMKEQRERDIAEGKQPAEKKRKVSLKPAWEEK